MIFLTPHPSSLLTPIPNKSHCAGKGREGMMVAAGGRRWINGKLFAKTVWGKEHFISPGPLAWKHLFPFKSARDFCLPRKPKSCGGRSEKSRRWPGDFKRILACSRGPVPEGLWNCVPVLAPCQIREKLSLPINFSVSFSHPCCEGV